MRKRGSMHYQRIAIRRTGRLRAVGVLVIASALSLAFGVSTSSALLAHLENGETISYERVPGAPSTGANVFSEVGPLMTYHGGPVMPKNTNYTIYWKHPKTKYAIGYKGGISKYFKDIAHDSGKLTNVESTYLQYGPSYVSKFGGVITDKDPYPANGCTDAPICITDAQIRAEIQHVVEVLGLPRDLEHEYFLLTSEGVESCFNATSHQCSGNSSSAVYCAFHNYIPSAGGPIVYANQPYVLNKVCDEPSHHPNGASDSALIGALSHEQGESVTDPELNAWYNEFGEENGDICRHFEPQREFGTPLGTAPNGSPYNQVINTRPYWYQQEWRNEGSECKQRK
jgi:hypothetical protein